LGGKREYAQKPANPKARTVPMILRRKSESVPKYQIKRANKDSAIRNATIGDIEVIINLFLLENRGRKFTGF
jgi:hypothetical protein